MRFAILIALFACAGVAQAVDMLKSGDTFPAWSLVDQTGATVASHDLAGKTYLLWFYSKAMTPGCTAEGQGLRDHFDAFQSAGIEIIGVSFDDPKDNASFVEQQHFPFRLLSDRDRTLATVVGAADARDQAVARRISYLVGPDGKVRRAYNAVSPATHAQQVLDDVRQPVQP